MAPELLPLTLHFARYTHPWIRKNNRVGNELCALPHAVLSDFRKQRNSIRHKRIICLLTAFYEREKKFWSHLLNSLLRDVNNMQSTDGASNNSRLK